MDRCASCGDVLADDAEDRVICEDCRDSMEQDDPLVPENLIPDEEVECGMDPLCDLDIEVTDEDEDEDEDEDDEDEDETL